MINDCGIRIATPEAFRKVLIDIALSVSLDAVLDPFLGSGTTAKVAKQLNRKFIGIEISQEYIDIAKERLK